MFLLQGKKRGETTASFLCGEKREKKWERKKKVGERGWKDKKKAFPSSQPKDRAAHFFSLLRVCLEQRKKTVVPIWHSKVVGLPQLAAKENPTASAFETFLLERGGAHRCRLERAFSNETQRRRNHTKKCFIFKLVGSLWLLYTLTKLPIVVLWLQNFYLFRHLVNYLYCHQQPRRAAALPHDAHFFSLRGNSKMDKRLVAWFLLAGTPVFSPVAGIFLLLPFFCEYFFWSFFPCEWWGQPEPTRRSVGEDAWVELKGIWEVGTFFFLSSF